jgi:AcrR family transcriptional regulator
MSESVKPRTYRSSVREEQARRTRMAILDAARLLFTEQGYAATTIAQIAARAGVAVDTVYAAAGTKPVLTRLLMETAISGSDQAVPPEERDYVRRIRAAGTASEKIRIYATAVTEVNSRLAPLHLVLRNAAAQAPELGELWTEIATRRAGNMRLFAQDLAATGELRPGLDVEEVADVVWSLNSAEYYSLLVRERGWPPARLAAWLDGTWCRLFLASPSASPSAPLSAPLSASADDSCPDSEQPGQPLDSARYGL